MVSSNAKEFIMKNNSYERAVEKARKMRNKRRIEKLSIALHDKKKESKECLKISDILNIMKTIYK